MRKQIRRREPFRSEAELPDHLHPVLRRVYAMREHVSAETLGAGLNALVPAERLTGIDAATELLAKGLAERWRMLIVGDFDADGATSAALAMRALQALGVAEVDYLVPNRFEYGYGLTPEIVELAAERSPDLIITVDNGISSIEGVAAANQRGIRVLVTDHHLPGSTLPAADAIVNPNLNGCPFPSKHLAGVGVIFYIMLALRARLRARGWFEQDGRAEPNMAELLDLVALGTVADVVVLDANNRILVEQGIRRIRAGRCRPGIMALLKVAGRDHKRLSASDLGFAVGPRLNAAGRLEDMSVGIECLLAEDPAAADELAVELDRLNRQRREIEAQMQAEALADVERLQQQWEHDSMPAGLCLMDRGWHQGVIGILAGRLKERFHRPVIAFAPAGDGELKGSARSIPGLHMRDLLDLIATRHPGLIDRFGGHAMAAGLSIREEAFEQFHQAFIATVNEKVAPELLEGVILSDGELGPEALELAVAEALREGGPWGQGFPEPVFDGEFDIDSSRVVGERHVKFTLRHPRGAGWIDAIAFNGVDQGWDQVKGKACFAYRLDVNEFRGQRSAQLIVDYLEPANS